MTLEGRALEILLDGKVGRAALWDVVHALAGKPQEQWAEVIVAAAARKAVEWAQEDIDNDLEMEELP